MKIYILILSLCCGLLVSCVQKVPQTADCTTIETFEKEASEYPNMVIYSEFMDRCYLIFPDEIAYKDLRDVSRQYVKEIQDVNPNLRLRDIFQKHYHNRCSDVEKNAMVFKYQYFIRDYANKTYLRDALRHNVDEDIKIASHGGTASIRALCDDTALKIRQYR